MNVHIETLRHTEAERAVLALAEAMTLLPQAEAMTLLPQAGAMTLLPQAGAMTLLPQAGVSDALVDAVRAHFDAAQTARTMFAVVLINSWNRIAVADRLPLSLLARLRAAH